MKQIDHGFAIFTYINGRLSSWAIYQNDHSTGRVKVVAMYDGHLSWYSGYTSESTAGTVYTNSTSNLSMKSYMATAQPGDAKYSVGWFGWAASFSQYEESVIAYALGGGATAAGIAGLFADGTIVGIPVGVALGVAAAIMGLAALILGGEALACSNGGYIGMVWSGSLAFGCNPAPWYL